MMRFIVVSSLILITSLSLVARLGGAVELGKPTQTTTFKGRNGQHTFVLRLAKGPFRKSRHKITGFRPAAETDYDLGDRRIDGRRWYGSDGGLPLEEFYTFKVAVDGKKWAIPSSLYRDCYEPNFHRPGRYPAPYSLFWVWLSKDGKRLTVKMHGSDGAGAYGVIWRFQKNGQHSRKIWSRV